MDVTGWDELSQGASQGVPYEWKLLPPAVWSEFREHQATRARNQSARGFSRPKREWTASAP